jgi:cell division protein FtsL
MQVNRTWRTKRPKSMKLYLSIIACTIILILYVSEQVYIFTLERKVNSIRNDVSELNTEISYLRIEVAELRKGSRIITIAQECLRMSMPEGVPKKLF